jgi:hypothetical protein
VVPRGLAVSLGRAPVRPGAAGLLLRGRTLGPRHVLGRDELAVPEPSEPVLQLLRPLASRLRPTSRVTPGGAHDPMVAQLGAVDPGR